MQSLAGVVPEFNPLHIIYSASEHTLNLSAWKLLLSIAIADDDYADLIPALYSHSSQVSTATPFTAARSFSPLSGSCRPLADTKRQSTDLIASCTGLGTYLYAYYF